MATKCYKGDRTIDGIVVTVDDEDLDPRLEIAAYTDQGFEWAYTGNEPRQLALAILLAHGLQPDHAIDFSKPFMHRVIAKLDNTWELDTADIDAVLTELKT